jgi:hypothetical protein
MAELDDLAGLLDDYHLYHASRAELLREPGHPGQARAADRRALELTANPTRPARGGRRLHMIVAPEQGEPVSKGPGYHGEERAVPVPSDGVAYSVRSSRLDFSDRQNVVDVGAADLDAVQSSGSAG